jgi:aminoglycoside phosphotransferase (APT) family kinase protein
VLAHNDLWRGNVLLDPALPWPAAARAGRFAIIDWAGAETSGYPLYDLIRLAQSVALRGKALADELSLHCRIVGGTLDDARPYLAAALGNLGLHLGQVPETRFVELANRCWRTLTSAVTA